ncbi:MAG: ChbG/HpnK family deacetylase [Dysosmobacter sp.]|nr:ChbG/HpnK family deacetylase [Dysosmobacter sp.]MDY3866272.1 ChbG/HpnK family deacetylase [Dysosmobacter sp.]
MEFIINADDFGISEAADDAIVRGFRDGLIDRTTLLVNMPQTRRACALARENGFFDRVGLHINLVEGVPLTERCRRDRTLCGGDGLFLGQFHRGLRGRFFLSRETREAIREETRAQIEAYLAMGFPLMHADSHQYVHTYFSAAQVILPLLEQYGFRSVRLSRNLPGTDVSVASAVYKRLFNRWVTSLRPQGRPIGHTDYFGSLEDWEAFPHQERAGTCELMVHPVYHDGVLFDDTLPTPKPFFTSEFLEKRGIRHAKG